MAIAASAPRDGIPPPWLRPTAAIVAVLAHALVLIGIPWPRDPEGPSLPPVEIEIVPQGAPARELVPPASQPAVEANAAEAPLAEATAPEAADESAAEHMAPTAVEMASPLAVETPSPTAEAPVSEEARAAPAPDFQPEAAAQNQAPVEVLSAEPRTEEARPSESAEALPPAVAIEPPLREALVDEVLPLASVEQSRPAASPRENETAPASKLAPERSEMRAAQRRVTAAEHRTKQTNARRERAQAAREGTDRAEARQQETARKRNAAVAARIASEAAHRQALASSAARASAAASARAGVPGASTTGASSTTNYGALVVAELNRRKRYPESARAVGAQGVVLVTFTIGPSGRVSSHAIARSSGNPTLDGAVSSMMASVSLPPPPGGAFRATAPIRFTLLR